MSLVVYCLYSLKQYGYTHEREHDIDLAIRLNHTIILKLYYPKIYFTPERFINACNNRNYKLFELFINMFSSVWIFKFYIENIEKIHPIDEKIYKLICKYFNNLQTHECGKDILNMIKGEFDEDYYSTTYTRITFTWYFQSFLEAMIKINYNDIIKKAININRFALNIKVIKLLHLYNNIDLIKYIFKNRNYCKQFFNLIIKYNDINFINLCLKYYIYKDIHYTSIKSKKVYDILINNNFEINDLDKIKISINLDNTDILNLMKCLISEKKYYIINSALRKNKINIVKYMIPLAQYDISLFELKGNYNNAKGFLINHFKNLQG